MNKTDIKIYINSQLILTQGIPPICKVLIVGAGNGAEAVNLKNQFPAAEIIGIDIETAHFRHDLPENVHLVYGDCTRLNYQDESFDLVYSYHALEHIPDYKKAVSEMYRVLKPNGVLFLGTPNRQRLLAYYNSPGVSFKEMIQWNLTDIKAMVSGRFKNEYGAHAGYKRMELIGIVKTDFDYVKDITDEYFFNHHPKYKKMLLFFKFIHLLDFLLPSVYVFARRPIN